MKKVVILGSTGSIGRQALEVIDAKPDLFEVIALCAGSDEATLTEQAGRHPRALSGLGEQAALEMAALPEADVVLNGIVGAAGLKASLVALEAGTTLALANKESLIAGGDLCLSAAALSGARIIPVDSEHAALAQCLEGRDRHDVRRVFLTASGGPFRERSDLDAVTPAEALAHPTWSMGPKITVDSATMMNKGLEIIEAHFLFGFDYDDIEVVVHPQSIIHAMAELVDGSMIFQAAPTDMRIPIQAALAEGERVEALGGRLEPRGLGDLHFTSVDDQRFPAVRLAYDVGRRGATFPAVLNAANEVAVQAFLDGHLAFPDIVAVTQAVVERHSGGDASSIEGVLEADAWARAEAFALLTEHPVGAGGVA
jgi:1-deoxy-D-xylulose-5-phosphate reductoisomerase